MSLRKSLAFGALMAAIAAVTPAYADLNGAATASVFVNVNPNIGVVANTPTVNAGTVQTGNFTATIAFQVDANLQEVSFSVDASALYKGDDPTGTAVAPIPLLLSAGVLVQPVNGNATNGHSNTLSYLGAAGPTVQNFPTTATETVQFSSSQNNHFSQIVNVTVTWNQTDPELPTGEYSGVVQLIALVAG